MLAVLVGSAGHAHAEPTPAEIEAKIDAKWREIEPTIEEHNAVRIKLNNEKKKVEDLKAKLAPLEQAVHLTRARIGVYADYMYKSGRAAGLNAFLSSGNPAILAQRMTSIDQVTHNFNARISDVREAKAKLDEAKRPLDALVAQLSALEAEQAARIAKIKADIDGLNKMRLAAYSSGSGLGELRPVPCPATYPGGDASIAAKFACNQIGKPYVFAADGPGSYDCSGLTMAAWRKAGVSLPHNARAQRSEIPYISRSELRPGDLVFYYDDLSHVGMYAGKVDGVHWIVHASRAGVPIKMRRMDQGGNIHSYGRPG